MEDQQTAVTTVTPVSEIPVQSQTVSAEELSKRARIDEQKGMLSNARNTYKMLQDFKAAIEGSTVSGHVVYRLAIGIQFLDSLIRQAKADIDRLQEVVGKE
jgi:hypothetical protein